MGMTEGNQQSEGNPLVWLVGLTILGIFLVTMVSFPPFGLSFFETDSIVVDVPQGSDKIRHIVLPPTSGQVEISFIPAGAGEVTSPHTVGDGVVVIESCTNGCRVRFELTGSLDAPVEVSVLYTADDSAYVDEIHVE